MSEKTLRSMYFTRTEGEFPDTFEISGVKYEKVEDLRYGTNPHQPAAFYRPAGADSLVIGGMKILKQGKSGLSQTNLEDISYALNMIKYMQVPSCAVMKHVNPQGAAYCLEGETQKDVYIKARDCDPLAAFGSVVGFNIKRFDYSVLRAYTNKDLLKLTTFDILEDVYQRLGFRLGLDHLAKETLNKAKSADGLQALEWFKQGEMEKLIDYCRRDVEVTRDLFQHGLDKGHLIYRTKRDDRRVMLRVDWNLDALLK